jgi:hypothetical protein
MPKDQSNDRRAVTPPSLPQTTPPQFAQGHDFTLQAVIEMQKSIGELVAKTDRLIADVSSQGEKIDAVRIVNAWVGGAFALLIFLFGVVISIMQVWPLPKIPGV